MKKENTLIPRFSLGVGFKTTSENKKNPSTIQQSPPPPSVKKYFSTF
jgi:hypothetical protein